MARYHDGLFQKNYDTNAFMNNIKGIKNIQVITHNMYEEEVEMSPIDYVARAVLLLSKTPKQLNLFHCFNDKVIPTGAIIDVLNSRGNDIKVVSNDEFKEIYKKNMNDNIQGIVISDMSLDIFDDDESDILLKNEFTSNILKMLDVTWPLPDAKYLKILISNLIDVGFL